MSGSFRVEAFRVPTMKALIQPVQQAPVNADRVEVDIQVSYRSGGGAGNAPVKLRGLLQPKAVSFPDYEGFVFANGRVQEGVEPEAGQPGSSPISIKVSFIIFAYVTDHPINAITPYPGRVVPIAMGFFTGSEASQELSGLLFGDKATGPEIAPGPTLLPLSQ